MRALHIHYLKGDFWLVPCSNIRSPLSALYYCLIFVYCPGFCWRVAVLTAAVQSPVCNREPLFLDHFWMEFRACTDKGYGYQKKEVVRYFIIC